MPQASGKRRKKDSDTVENFGFKYNAPTWSPAQFAELERAARTYAEHERSDPFAYGRMLAHLKRGIADVEQVSADNRTS